MRIIGYRNDAGSVHVGALSDEGTSVAPLATLEQFWIDPVRFLANRRPARSSRPRRPVRAAGAAQARVICIGLNYLEHVAEGSYADQELPEYPTLFARWSRSLTVDGAEVPMPANEDGLDWEGEIVAWVGSRLVDATPEQALAAVVGYSTFNDLTARRAQKITSQWILGKNGDQSGPLGPWFPPPRSATCVDGLRVQTRVNGKIVQAGTTDQMVYTVGDTLAHISRTFTVEPGDLLATGTPSGVGYARTQPGCCNPGTSSRLRSTGWACCAT